MNILVLNGSPKGKYSVTLQTIRYLEALNPAHSFQVLNVGQTIKSLEKDFSPAKEAIAWRKERFVCFCKNRMEVLNFL